MDRPYGDAVRQLSGAWKHLKMRRTKGDNDARRLLREHLHAISLRWMDECLRFGYAPSILAQLNEPSPAFRIFGATQ